jgi:beta-lactamase class A
VNRLLPLATGAVLGAVIAATGAVLTGLSDAESRHAAGHSAPPANVATHRIDTEIAQRAQQAVRVTIPDAGVGVEVFDRQTGEVLTTADADQQFASMSVVKLVIALDILSEKNWAPPDATTQDQLTRMLSYSDDGIANDLWTEDGGPQEVVKIARMLNLTGTQPPPDPNEWGDTLTTAHDMVLIYRFILDRLPAPDRDLVRTALSNSPHYAADGFDQYFGIPNALPPNATWAIKQGWGTSGDKALINTTGVVGTDSRYVVVMLTTASANEYLAVPPAVTAGTRALSVLVGGTQAG